MEKISSALYGDMYHATMPDGLHVWVYPDQSAATAYVLLDTKVGSVDDMLPGPKGPKQIPGGVAHFLEHKMFETPEGDVFYQFGRQGADANAYTSFDDTCYLFSCTEQFEQNLTTLLQQVKTGYFTPENVEKEKGIIGQEIRMYDDDAEWQSTFLLLKSLYHSTSITEDIAGTVDSIQQIDADLLNQVFAQYYTPGNQCLAVAGRVDPDKVFDICLAHHSGGVTAPPSRCQIVEPKEIVTPCITRQLPVAVPLACLGFKEQVQGDMGQNRLLDNFIMELLVGETTPFYRDCYREGIINESFETEVFSTDRFHTLMFSCETTRYNQFVQAIYRRVEQVKATGLNREDFELLRRDFYGKRVRALKRPEAVATAMAAGHFAGQNLFEVTDRVRHIPFEAVEQRLQQILNREYSALSLILPQGGKD